MSSVQGLRKFVNERLTAATEEILEVFEKTVKVYEEEINRQRKLLDTLLKPEIKLHRIEISQPVCIDKALDGQQLCVQERNISLDHEDPEPPQIKEEQEEQLVLKQESDLFKFRPTCEGSDHSEEQILHLLPLPLTNIPVEAIKSESDAAGSCLSEPNCDHHLSDNSERVTSQDPGRGNQENASSDQKTENKPFKCVLCPEEFNEYLMLGDHIQTHSDVKPFKCDTCGKEFALKTRLKTHMIGHTGFKPFICEVCGKEFCSKSNCVSHLKTHTGEKSHSCITCGKKFRRSSDLTRHIQIHTGEKPYSCVHCGKRFARFSTLTLHVRVHTGEKPYQCNWCGKKFASRTGLRIHSQLHSGEPFVCEVCGKEFYTKSNCVSHMKTHTDTLVCWP
ncbi:gastrula zinc finger protein XlCGF8.2DB-like isoform X3 [Acanthopagrus latus]|uniref:gastrula zinc finger protein XlCGF8.2DB-like isoform X3 n=1 Tax=Acanthopagrus latus TaxID=8177 RepID=UPI00187C7C30|nr:gastrula zinc finger protein XlCGF8.2DB-like isoform X3 [Acanthopagrus latus]